MIRQIVLTAILIGMLSFGLPASNTQVVPQPRIAFVLNDSSIRIPHRRDRQYRQKRRNIIYL